jgi:site-specific recombinase XerD
MKRHGKRKDRPEKVTVGNVKVAIYHRRKAGYDVFEVADYSNGPRRLRSFADHARARAEAERIARLLSAGEVAALDLRPNERASYGRAVELLRPTGVPLELAAAHFAQAVQILGSDRLAEAAKFFVERNPDRLPSKTVSEVVTELLAAKEARGLSERYLQDLRCRLRRLAQAFQTQVASITTADVQRWLDGIKGGPVTLRNYQKAARTFFSFAETRGYIFKGANPVIDTETIQNGNHGPVVIWTPEEMEKLLAAAPAEFLPCLAVGAFAGLRSAEIERLDWKEVHMADRLIEVTARNSKCATRRLVPMVENLMAWLAPHAKQAGPLWKGGHQDFYLAQQKTAAAAGLNWKANACRHSFCSYRLAKVQSAAQVALEAGNSPTIVFRHYRELVKPADADRWFSIRPAAVENVITLPRQKAA